MEIASVGASGAYSSTSVQPGRPQAAQEAQVQRSEPRELPPEQRVEATEQASRPVINAQGETTGTRINVTA